MRFQIHRFQQDELINLGLGVEDALLLDWFMNFKDGNGMTRYFDEESNDIAYWVAYDKIIADLPILFTQVPVGADEVQKAKIVKSNKAKIARMFKKYESIGLLKRIPTVKKTVGGGTGTKIHILLNREIVDTLVNGGKQEEVQEVDEIQVKSDKEVFKPTLHELLNKQKAFEVYQDINKADASYSTLDEELRRDILFEECKRLGII
ncbi:MAG: hypothetical protein ACRDB0_04505 [Paraclostridium sp.]